MTAPWWVGLSPAEAPVDCAGAVHRLRWVAGVLTAANHLDVERERTLAALGGQPYPCIELLDAWSRHADDLTLLVLAGRGGDDRIGVDRPRGGFASYSALARPALSSRRGIARGPGPGRAGHVAYAGPVAGLHTGDPGDEAVDLLTLDGGLPERLVAGVIATWAGRLEAGDAGAAAESAALYAALYGRAVAALRGFVGADALDADVQMLPPGEPARVSWDGATPTFAAPFSWLRDVWAKGMSTVLDRLCLSAEPVGDHGWVLTTVGRDLGAPATVTITVGQ